VGTLAMMQGGCGISKDLPPFAIGRGINLMSGLNTVGLRRAGVTTDERLQLKRLYHRLFMSKGSFRAALEEAREEFDTPLCRTVTAFLALAKRGVCAHSNAGLQED
jgi:UDP-N-acetylglucosamine acyltransferase